MITLKGSGLKNIVMYEEAYLPLDRVGLTVIYGRNMDSSDDPLKSNGAGKSLLLTTMAETLMDQHPLLEGRHIVKDAFGPDSRCMVDFDDYRLEKSMAGKTIKYDLFKNVKGKFTPTKVRTVAYVWEKMKQLFPVTNDQFFSLYYIDSSRGSVIQRGSHSQRLALFSSLLNLDQYDVISEQVKARMKALRAHDIKLSTILDQIAVHEKDVTKSLAKDVEKLEQLQARQKKLSSKRSELTALVQQATVYQTHHPVLKGLKKSWSLWANRFGKEDDANWSDPDFIGELIDALGEGTVRIKKQIKVMNAAAETSASLRSARKRLDKMTPDKLSLAQLKEQLTEALSREEEVAGLRREVKALEKELAPLSEPDTPRIAKMKKRLVDLLGELDGDSYLAEAIRQLAVSEAELKAAKAEQKEFKDSTGGAETCPTCKTVLSQKSLAKLAQAYAAEVLELTNRVGEQQEIEALARKWGKAALEAVKYQDLKAKLGEAQDKLDCEMEALAELHQGDEPESVLLTARIAQVRDRNKLVKEVAGLEEQQIDVNSDEEVDVLNDRVQEYVTAWNQAKALKPYHRTLFTAIDAGAGDYDLEDLEEKQAELDDLLNQIMKEIPTLTQVVSVAKNAQIKLKALDAKRLELEEQLQDMPVLKVLAEAYGSKGLKNIAIQRAATLIECNLNLYSVLLFSEPIQFSLEVDETHLHIIATREFKGKTITSDVRRLSGAESAAFNLLMPMAILPLVPDSMRLNIMALDEPTAHMDQPGIDLFATKFVPKLLQLVPHVIILSPTRMDLEHDTLEQWCVTRQGGVSVLEKVA